MRIGADLSNENKIKGSIGSIYLSNRALGSFPSGGFVPLEGSVRVEPDYVHHEVGKTSEMASPPMFTWATASIIDNTLFTRIETNDNPCEKQEYYKHEPMNNYSPLTQDLHREYSSNEVDEEERRVGIAVEVGNTLSNETFYVDNFNVYQQGVTWYFDAGHGFERAESFYDGGVVNYTLTDFEPTNRLDIKAEIDDGAWVKDITIKPNTRKITEYKSEPFSLDVSIEHTVGTNYTYTISNFNDGDKIFIFYTDPNSGETRALTKAELNTTNENENGWGYLTTSTVSYSDAHPRELGFLVQRGESFSRLWKPKNIVTIDKVPFTYNTHTVTVHEVNGITEYRVAQTGEIVYAGQTRELSNVDLVGA